MSSDAVSLMNGNSIDNDDFVVVQRSEADDNAHEDTDDSSTAFSPEPLPEGDPATTDIEFFNVQRVYPTDRDIRVRCSVARPFRHSEMDSIGIYRLGWSDPSQVVASEYVQPVPRHDHLFTTLRSCFLPTNPTYDEYYQFAYVCQDGKTVKGVSAPFHLIRSIANDGASTLSTVAKDARPQSPARPADLCTKCGEVNSLKNRLDAALQSKALATSELAQVQERYEHLNNVFQAQTVEGRKTARAAAAAEAEVVELRAAAERQAKTMHEMVTDFSTRAEEMEALKGKLRQAEEEKDGVVAASSALQQTIADLTRLADERALALADKENWCASLSAETERLAREKDAAKEEKENAEAQRGEILSQLEVIQVDRAAQQEEKILLSEQLAETNREAASVIEELARTQEELSRLQHAEEEDADHLSAWEVEKRELIALAHDLTDHRPPTLRETLSAAVEERRERAAEMERLRRENACLRPHRRSQSEMEDADTLLRFLPSLTQQLLNMSNAAPTDSQNVISELRDMIRFLLTAHERMKRELMALRNGQASGE